MWSFVGKSFIKNLLKLKGPSKEGEKQSDGDRLKSTIIVFNQWLNYIYL